MVKGESSCPQLGCKSDAERMAGKRQEPGTDWQPVQKEGLQPENKEEHYFKVVMENVDVSSDLLDIELIREYLSEVAPVPYDARRFLVVPEIKKFLAAHNYKLTEFNIFLG